MNNSFITISIRVALVIIAVLGLIICAYWYPFSISLSVMGVVDSTPTFAQNIQMWTQLLFYWLVSLPCFGILILVWLITNSIKKGLFFSEGNVIIVKKITMILFFDLIVFFIGNIVFLILGWNDYAMIYFIIFIIGLGGIILIKGFEHYLKKTVKFKKI